MREHREIASGIKFKDAIDIDGLQLQHLDTYSGNRLIGATRRVKVNKATHRIRFEDESESQVTVVIEPKEQG